MAWRRGFEDASVKSLATRTDFKLVSTGAKRVDINFFFLGNGNPCCVFQNDAVATRSRATLAERRRFIKRDRKSTRLNSSHLGISYAVFCLKKKKLTIHTVYYVERPPFVV